MNLPWKLLHLEESSATNKDSFENAALNKRTVFVVRDIKSASGTFWPKPLNQNSCWLITILQSKQEKGECRGTLLLMAEG